MSKPRSFPGLTLALVLAAGCAHAPAVHADRASDPVAQITAMLNASARSWNDGDLAGYVDDYAKDATFVGSSGLVRGRAEIERRYRASYWASGKPRDALRFENLEVTLLGREHALAVGRYVLYDRQSGVTTASGIFSLVLRYTPDGWRIIHDHSSAAG
ncbi:MAG: nuclear transport factor 2 family protein [Gemmatimonadota bacterium]